MWQWYMNGSETKKMEPYAQPSSIQNILATYEMWTQDTN